MVKNYEKDMYADLAEYYDKLIPSDSKFISYYSNFARNLHPCVLDILDLGAGTGVPTIALAQDNHYITALDYSKEMLERLQNKITAFYPEVVNKITLVHGDQRHFSLGKKYDLALISGGTLQHCMSEDEYIETFTCVRDHLHNGGMLTFDVELKPEKMLQKGHYTERFVPYTMPWLQYSDKIFSENRIDFSNTDRIANVQSLFMIKDAHNHILKTFDFSCVYTYFTPEKIMQLLTVSGFAIKKIWGGFSGEPLGDESRNLVIVSVPN